MPNNNLSLVKDALDALKRQAFRTYDEMPIVYPWNKKEKLFLIKELVPRFNDCFSMINETVCFIIDNNVYVAPYSNEIFYLLGLARMKEAVFNVPFCYGEYPKYGKNVWDELCQKSSRTTEDAFEKGCIKYSDRKGLLELDDEVLKNCFKMPDTGVLVKHRMYKVTYYPYIIASAFNRESLRYIGNYWNNGGKVAFIYRDGRTYVGKGYKLAEMLKEAKYREREIFVPFSNGEKILNPVQKDVWMSLKKFI